LIIIIGNFLYEVEKKWPLDIFHFSQDAALEFLMFMKFDYAKTIKFIHMANKIFKSFIKGKIFY